MLIQRRPGVSMISTRGSSRSAGRASRRERAERRPNGLLGRLGMARTEGIVGRRHDGQRFYAPPETPLTCLPYSSAHPEGWRDWPNEAPPTIPPQARRETVAIPTGSKTTAWEMRGAGFAT